MTIKVLQSFGLSKKDVLVKNFNNSDITPIKIGFNDAGQKFMEFTPLHDRTTLTLADGHVLVKNGEVTFKYVNGDNFSVHSEVDIVTIDTLHTGEELISVSVNEEGSGAEQYVSLNLNNDDSVEANYNALHVSDTDNLHIMTKDLTIGGVTITNFTYSVVPREGFLDRFYYKDSNGDHHLLFSGVAGPDNMAEAIVYFVKDDETTDIDNVYKVYRYDKANAEFTVVADKKFLLDITVNTGHNMSMSEVGHDLFTPIFANDGSNVSDGYYFYTSDHHVDDADQVEIFYKYTVSIPGSSDPQKEENTIYFQKHHDGSFQELIDFDGKKVAFEESEDVSGLLVRYDLNETDKVLEINAQKVHYHNSGTEDIPTYELINTDGHVIGSISRDISDDSGGTTTPTENGYFSITKGVSRFYKYDETNNTMVRDNDNFYFTRADESVIRITDTFPNGWEDDDDFILDIHDEFLGYYGEVTGFEDKGVYQFDYLDDSRSGSGVYYKNAANQYVSTALTLVIEDDQVGYYKIDDATNSYTFKLFNTTDGSETDTDGYYYKDKDEAYQTIAEGSWKTDGHKLFALNDNVGYFDTTQISLSSKLSKFVSVDSSNGNSAAPSSELYYNKDGGSTVDSYARLVEDDDDNSFTDATQLHMSGANLGYFGKTNGEIIYSFYKIAEAYKEDTTSNSHKKTVKFVAEDAESKTFYTKSGDVYTQFTLNVTVPENAVFTVDGNDNIILQSTQNIKSNGIDNGVYYKYPVDITQGVVEDAVPNIFFFKEDNNSFTEIKIQKGSNDNQWQTTDKMIKIDGAYGTFRGTNADLKTNKIVQFHEVAHEASGDGSVSLVEDKWYKDNDDNTYTHITILNGKDVMAASSEVFYYEAEHSDNVYKKHVVNEMRDEATVVKTTDNTTDNNPVDVTYFKDETDPESPSYTAFTLPDGWDPIIHTLLGWDNANGDVSQKVGMDSNGDLIDVYVKGTFASPITLDFTKFYNSADVDTDASGNNLIINTSVLLLDDTGAYKEYTLGENGNVAATKFYLEAAKTNEITDFDSEDTVVGMDVYRKDAITGAWQKGDKDNVTDNTNYYLDDGQKITDFDSEDRYDSDTEMYLKTDDGTERWQKKEIDTTKSDDSENSEELRFVEADKVNFYEQDGDLIPVISYKQDATTGAWLKHINSLSANDGKYYWSNDNGATVKEITNFTSNHKLIEDSGSYYITKNIDGIFEGNAVDTSGIEVTFSLQGFATSEDNVKLSAYLTDMHSSDPDKRDNYTHHIPVEKVIYHYEEDGSNDHFLYFYDYANDAHKKLHYSSALSSNEVGIYQHNDSTTEYVTNNDAIPVNLGVFFQYKMEDIAVNSDFTYKINDDAWGRATLDSASDTTGVTFTWKGFYDTKAHANDADGTTGILFASDSVDHDVYAKVVDGLSVIDDFTYKINDDVWGRATFDSAPDTTGVTFTWKGFYDTEAHADDASNTFDKDDTGILQVDMNKYDDSDAKYIMNRYDEDLGILYNYGKYENELTSDNVTVAIKTISDNNSNYSFQKYSSSSKHLYLMSLLNDGGITNNFIYMNESDGIKKSGTKLSGIFPDKFGDGTMSEVEVMTALESIWDNIA